MPPVLPAAWHETGNVTHLVHDVGAVLDDTAAAGVDTRFDGIAEHKDSRAPFAMS